MSPDHAGALTAWARALDELDAMASVAGEHAGETAVAHLAAWTPPTGLGRLPAELVDRALEVLVRQADVVDRLHAAIVENRRHSRALTCVPRAHDSTAAAYLDVSA